MTEPDHIMKIKKYTLFFLLAILIIVAYLYSGLWKQYLLSNIEILKTLHKTTPMIFSLAYALAYTVLVTLSIPVALILGLLAGAIFDPLNAIIIISFASSIGATAAMLLARYFI